MTQQHNPVNCIIIEDLDTAADRLENQLQHSGYQVDVLAKIDSVEDAVHWLKNNQTELIFLDVELGDGLGFEIFDHVQIATPVIFTTSYDHYMTRAFELNSISYILKPVDTEDLRTALNKHNFLQSNQYINKKIVTLQQDYQQRFLVRDGSSLKPIPVEDVAWFYVENKHFVFLMTKSGKQYLYDSTLEILEQRLNPSAFFRINRSFIINFSAITQVNGYDNSRRFILETEPTSKAEVTVSREKCNEFRVWLNR